MEFNWIIFPAPKFSKNSYEQKDIIYVPRPIKKNKSCLFYSSKDQIDSIPCRYMAYQENNSYSDKIMIFFHGNAEDLSVPNIFAYKLCHSLGINVLLVEYPGYGYYPGSPSSYQIEEDAQIVYEFLISKGCKHQNIYVFGRSIGSGPATFLAKNNPIGCLILMSAYTNIRDASKFLVGSFLSRFVK